MPSSRLGTFAMVLSAFMVGVVIDMELQRQFKMASPNQRLIEPLTSPQLNSDSLLEPEPRSRVSLEKGKSASTVPSEATRYLTPLVAEAPEQLPLLDAQPGGARKISTSGKGDGTWTSWSWANYTRPPHDQWPRCSKAPSSNCVDVDHSNKACTKWRQIGNHAVIVGDMDGSGSRGIVMLLRAGGVWMRTTNEWLDWAKSEHGLANTLMEQVHSMDYSFKALTRQNQGKARDQVKNVLKEFTNVGQTQLANWPHRKRQKYEEGLDPRTCPVRIGWKHGPTLFLQPLYEEVTGGRFTFVHLIRDGRDMAFSRNRNNLAKYPKFGGQVVGLFNLGKKTNYNKCFFKAHEKHSAEKDRECIVMQMRLWERMNLGAADYGHRQLGLRYVPIRIEDLILPADMRVKAKTILLLFRRLGVTTVTTQEQAAALSSRIFGSEDLQSHFSITRWGGCGPEILDEVESAGAEGLRRFAYLPWRNLLQYHQDRSSSAYPIGCAVGQEQIQVARGGKEPKLPKINKRGGSNKAKKSKKK